METQNSIVAEIEAEQARVSANRELMERMEGRIAAAIGRVWYDGTSVEWRRIMDGVIRIIALCYATLALGVALWLAGEPAQGGRDLWWLCEVVLLTVVLAAVLPTAAPRAAAYVWTRFVVLFE